MPFKCRRIHLLLKCTWNTISRIDHILGHKSNLSKFKKIEIVSCIFSDHNAVRLDINYKRKPVRNTNTWRLNNTFPNNQQVTEEIKREIKKFLETNDNENTTQNLWDAAKVVLREKFIAIQFYLKKQEKHRMDSLILHIKKKKKQEKEGKKLVEGKKSQRSEQKQMKKK